MIILKVIALICFSESHFLCFVHFLSISHSFCSLNCSLKILHTLTLFSVFFQSLSLIEEAEPSFYPTYQKVKNSNMFPLKSKDFKQSIFFDWVEENMIFLMIYDQLSCKYPFDICNDFIINKNGKVLYK